MARPSDSREMGLGRVKAEVCVILAGGQSRRMGGGDKALLMLDGQSLLARVIARLGPQVSQIGLNANGDAARFAAFGLPVFPDPAEVAGQGPLARIVAAMDWARSQGFDRVVTVAADLPFLPRDLVARLTDAGAPCFAGFGAGDPRAHPTCGLWHVAQRDDLAAYLAGGGRRMMEFTRKIGAQMVVWDGTVDPFMNLNTPDDFARAKAMIPDV